jgi:hypothetical protein
MGDVMFATRVATGGAKTQFVRCSVNWTTKRGACCATLQKRKAESRTAIT